MGRNLKQAVTSKITGKQYDAGIDVDVSFDNGQARLHFPDGQALKVRATRLHALVSGFSKPPTMATLERWSNDGVCRTVTGYKVEPDGIGPDGSPSWLLALGLI